MQRAYATSPRTFATYATKPPPPTLSVTERREKQLYQAALDVERGQALHEEMQVWNVTLQDGLCDEAW